MDYFTPIHGLFYTTNSLKSFGVFYTHSWFILHHLEWTAKKARQAKYELKVDEELNILGNPKNPIRGLDFYQNVSLLDNFKEKWYK